MSQFLLSQNPKASHPGGCDGQNVTRGTQDESQAKCAVCIFRARRGKGFAVIRAGPLLRGARLTSAFGGASSEGLDVRNPNCCIAAIAVRAFISEFAMIEVVDRILNEYQSIRPLDAERLADSRLKISRYLEVLGTAGLQDTKQLAMYGLAYLREMHEGRDPRFTGC